MAQPIESPVVQHNGQLFLSHLNAEQSMEEASQLPVESHLDYQMADETQQRQSMSIYGSQPVGTNILR